MSIPQLNGPERLSATRAAAAARRNTPATVANPSVAREPDGVTISDSARSLAAARDAVSNAPDTRDDKVNALKAALANGTYSVNSRRLANAMLRTSDT